MIQCKNLCLKDRKYSLIKNLCLDLPNSQITALYGPTGSGKTLLFLIFAGLMKPQSGEVIIDGLNVTKMPKKARRNIGLGVIPEFSPLVSKFTLRENLILQARMLKVKHPKEKVQELLMWLNIENYAQTLTEDLPAFVNAKASLATGLLNDPTTILLDEPEHRLTSEETQNMWKFLNELKFKGKCIVVATRYQEVAEKCDNTLIFSSGKVVESNETYAVARVRTKTTFA